MERYNPLIFSFLIKHSLTARYVAGTARRDAKMSKLESLLSDQPRGADRLVNRSNNKR